ncbi:MAG: thermonuclease family protein, partial [Candidatus Gracilibacteria bacterium]|nr:thermonuclease family protein [Candidatus Gracilibacteria bacterium]
VSAIRAGINLAYKEGSSMGMKSFLYFILLIGVCSGIPEFSTSTNAAGIGTFNSSAENPYEVIGIVSYVVDGDTFDVNITDNRDLRINVEKIRVRLADIDTPEIRGKKASQTGKDAANFTREELLGNLVYLDVDNKTGQDRYGRWVAVCYLGNDNFNLRLVDKGFAVIDDYRDNEFNPESW